MYLLNYLLFGLLCIHKQLGHYASHTTPLRMWCAFIIRQAISTCPNLNGVVQTLNASVVAYCELITQLCWCLMARKSVVLVFLLQSLQDVVLTFS